MANPFGELVDDEKLEEIARYIGKPKTQEDRAWEAMRVRTGEANGEARRYVDGVKEFYESGVCTLCMIYNATGETLYYVDDHDWYGNLCRTPYPTQIGNGQWVSFLHVHSTAAPSGSEAAVIYRGKQKEGLTRDFTLAWSTPFAAWYNNKAYCEMREAGDSSSWIYTIAPTTATITMRSTGMAWSLKLLPLPVLLPYSLHYSPSLTLLNHQFSMCNYPMIETVVRV